MRPDNEAGVTEVRVRYAETDQMGCVHHRHYLVWCELGRTSLMRRHGVSYAELERGGLMLPVSRAEVEYRVPAGYDDRIRIHTWLERVRSRQLVFSYRIASGDDDTTHAYARTALVCTDSHGRPRRLPEAVRRELAALVRATPSGAAP
ncbi:acyl-CoA thioesterase [Candidatus Palauibacter sp.]|uniref:acyl-CoA thioesterase n=1 Tax=Candidatus Palauibacter sp. TaxID=3101350 RepID=UPI003AF2B09B